jgi:hypothetical protein
VNFQHPTSKNYGDDSGYENRKEVDYADEKIIRLWYASFGISLSLSLLLLPRMDVISGSALRR